MPRLLDVDNQCRAPVWTNTCLPYFTGSFNFIHTDLSGQILLLAAVMAKVAIKKMNWPLLCVPSSWISEEVGCRSTECVVLSLKHGRQVDHGGGMVCSQCGAAADAIFTTQPLAFLIWSTVGQEGPLDHTLRRLSERKCPCHLFRGLFNGPGGFAQGAVHILGADL